MRTFIRTLAATAALAAVVLGAGASPAFAASDNGNPAATYRQVMHDDWCFDDGAIEYCTVADTVVSATFAPSGGAIVRIHAKSDVTMFADDGTQIGATKSTSFSRSVWSAEGQVSEFNIGHTRVSGPDGDCHFTVQVKIVAYEVVIARYLGPDCA